MTHDFHADQLFGGPGFTVRVTSTMEVLGDQPWMVTIIPDSPLLPTGSYVIEETSGFGAAADALERFKEEHHLNPSTVWAL